MTTFDRYNRITAALVGVIAFILYAITMAPTTSFWDCGEFITCSYSMGIAHPPGAPMFIMLGRVFSLLPFGDIGWRVNMISVLSSAVTIALLHLIIVRLIQHYRNEPEDGHSMLTTLAAGAVGALTFMTTYTVWFSAVEAEVYALSILLVALVIWQALVWADTHTESGSAHHLLLIIYLVGIGTGVHLLNVLALPAVFLLILFTDRRILLRLDLIAISALLVAVAYSIFLMILIRSGKDPYIDQNNPENWENFMAYLRRDQYGTESNFATFLDRKAPFWTYQFKKLFLRYFGWNFIGKGATIGPDNYIVETLSLRGIYGAPFLVGFYGMLHHFKKDWRNAMVVMTVFVMTGIALLIYLNQPDPQPRERDYIYVGSYFAFAIWIGIGVASIFETIAEVLRQRRHLLKPISLGALAILLLALPINMGAFNYHENDRSGNYLPWDYSHNILESCEPNAILITNGDNDTFPLWYLQQVEGVRPDVDIINLSLMNTAWYNLQLKNQHGVPISLSEEEIRKTQYVMLEKPVTVIVDIDAATNRQYMKELEGIRPLPEGDVQMSFEIKPTIQGRAIRLQDYIVLDILRTNAFKRPLYFAITVGSNSFIGLNEYVRLDGMAYKVTTMKNENQINTVPEVSWPIVKDRLQFRGTNDPDVYQDIQSQGLMRNYRLVLLKIAAAFYQGGKRDQIPPVLDLHEELVPPSLFPYRTPDVRMQVAQLFAYGGRSELLRKIVEEESVKPEATVDQLISNVQTFISLSQDRVSAVQILSESLDRFSEEPKLYSLLISLLEGNKDFEQLVSVLERWLRVRPDDAPAQMKLKQYQEMLGARDTAASAP
jgi:hypothetical protein